MNVLIPADQEVTTDLLLERSEKLTGLDIHGFERVHVHPSLDIPGFNEFEIKLVRFEVDCEGPDDRILALIEEAADFGDSEDE